MGNPVPDARVSGQGPYTTSDIEAYFSSTNPVKRDALVTALTGFVATQKVTSVGALSRARGRDHYQFEN